ncbi:MAG TPA: carbohydrate kinase family protein [Gammaproteobacteria bacterium]|nr:carbohydrate kinase family protein [Gammaproteobacteria bacterium]
MRTLICGSFAYDNIMVFQDRFKNHILPEQIHILNVCFLVPEMRREFGGCAGNIAYSLHSLGGQPVPMGTVGKDFSAYQQWLNDHEIEQHCIREVPDAYTAQAFITTDLDDNQITAFHPGAMNSAHLNTVADAEHISLGIVSPDGKQAMLEHAEQFHQAGIPFVFDPGQGLPMFDKASLQHFIELADYITVNNYEGHMLEQNSGLSTATIADRVKALIVTRGELGSQIHVDGKILEIPCAPASQTVDPTGCGDAYRGGLLYGIGHQLDWQATGQLAALMGAIKIETPGTQNYHTSADQVRSRYQQAYGSADW